MLMHINIKSMERYTGRGDSTEILLKMALNTTQSPLFKVQAALDPLGFLGKRLQCSGVKRMT